MSHSKSAEDQAVSRHTELLDALPAIVWRADAATFAFTFVNQAAEAILGYPSQQWMEANFWVEHLHPEDRGVIEYCVNETVAGRDHEMNYRMVAADGRVVWLRDWVRVRVSDGVPVELLGVMIDVTEARENENKLRRSEENLRDIVDCSPYAIGVHVDGRYVYVNDTCMRLLGATRKEELLGRTTFVHSDFRSVADEGHEQVMSGRTVPLIQVKFVRVDGSSVDVEVAAMRITFEGKQGVQIMARDISDMVESEAKLRQAEDGRARAEEVVDVISVSVQRELEEIALRYKQLMAGVSDVICTLDLEGRFTFLSDAFEKVSGYRSEDWIGRLFTDFLLPGSIAEGMQQFACGRSSDSGGYESHRILVAGGRVLEVEVSVNPWISEGRVIGVMAVVRDVTERKRMERRLEQANRLSGLGQVAASLAHEFNNVLMGIQPFVEVIGRAVPPAPIVQNALTHIATSIARGKRASQQILTYSNPKDAHSASFVLAPWLMEVAARLSVSPSTVSVRVVAPSDLTAFADREQVEQVLMNLATNAREAMPIGGTITLEAARCVGPMNSDGIRITLRDDGPGIPSEQLSSIFEPLFTTKRHGTGLGLPIALRLAEAQGGTISVESSIGVGSAFHVFLRQGQVPQAIEPQSLNSTRPERVLIVEDEPEVAEGMIALLELEGVRTLHLAEGKGTADAVRAFLPDVVILDINLPDVNGLDLSRKLRELWPHLPIVLSTGHVAEIVTTGATVSLMKPYSMDELMVAMQQALAGASTGGSAASGPAIGVPAMASDGSARVRLRM